MKNYFILASKNLKRRKIRSWLTLIGIFVGIAAVISLISLGNTLKETVNAQFDTGSLDVISVQAGGISWAGPPGSAVSNPLIEEDTKAIERINSVEYAISRQLKTVRAEFNNKAVFLMISSLPDNRKINYLYNELDIEAEQGRLLNEGETGKILIGKTLADGKKNGFEKDLRVGDKILVKEQEFRIVGILKGKGTFIIDSIVMMNEEELKKIANIDNEVDLISVKVKDIELIDITKEEIEKLMRQRRGVKIGEEDFEVSTSEASLKTINQILMGIQIFIVLIALISIIIGAIGIANTMFTSVLERRKEIGIMKAIGARNKDIFYLFFVEAGLLGLMGGIIGIVLGLGISFIGIYALNQFLDTGTKLSINLFLIFFSLIGSFVVGAVSGIIPAMRAAKENPVEAIKR